MTWTTTPPTEEGWYWAIRVGEPAHQPQVVFFTRAWEHSWPGRYIEQSGTDRPAALEEFQLWAGPILPPERT